MKKLLKNLVLGLQHVFAMFGATVLVPLLTGLDVGVALVASGVGTLIYIAFTKGKSPMYLGSSFAYIGAIATAASLGGFGSAFVGLIVVGLIYVIIALIISATGTKWLKDLLPPVVIGPMIIIIGMSLASVAISSAGLSGGADWAIPIVAVLTFTIVAVLSTFGKGFWKVVPFLIGILGGYIIAIPFGLVDFTIFSQASFLQIPNFTFIGTYSLDFSAVLLFAPLAFVTIAEHIGDHSVLGEIVDKDLLQDPGLNRTLLGDGVATMASAFIGGPANTSYGENIGVVAMTGVKSAKITGIAAIFAILLGFLGYIQAFVYSIPWAVIGGVTIILYGLIASSGVRVMIKNKVDMGINRNLIIVSTMLVVGLGGAVITIGSFSMMGMSLAMLIGMALNQLLPQEKKEI